MKRRRIALGLALVTAALLALWGFVIEPARLVVSEHQLRLSSWPRGLSGLRVAVLADLHVGSPHWDLVALRGLVELTNQQAPELVLLAGDYQINGVTGGEHVAIEPIAEQLGRLRAPLGVVAVLGNHDWWAPNDGERSRAALRARGVMVLEDEAVRLERGGASLWLVGLADQLERPSNPVTVMAKLPAGAASILIVHEPDVFASFPRLGLRPGLTVAGHTHGGQVRLPLLGRRVVPSEHGERYAYGHVVEAGRDLFVTSGVGTSIIPVRFLVPPEIALLTLTEADQPPM